MNKNKIKNCILICWLLILFNGNITYAFQNIDNEQTFMEVNKGEYISEIREISIGDIDNFDEIEEIIRGIEGVVVLSNNGNDMYKYYNLLIPKSYSDNSINKILSFGKVNYDNIHKTDESGEIFRLKTIIKNKENYKDVIMQLLKQTNDIETILELEMYLMDVEYSKTSMENQLKTLMENTNNVTLQLNLDKKIENVKKTNDITDATFKEKLNNSLKNSFNKTVIFFQYILISISYVIIPIIFFISIITFFIIVKKGGKKNENK